MVFKKFLLKQFTFSNNFRRLFYGFQKILTKVLCKHKFLEDF